MKIKHLLATAAVFLLLAPFISCTDEDQTRRVLYDESYTNVEIVGYSPFGCGKGDSTCTEFRAKNAAGKTIKGVVGCGFFMKACTVRH